MICYNIDRLVHRTRKGAKSKRLAYHFNGHCTKDKCNMTTITIPLSKTGKKNAGKYAAIVDSIDADLTEFNWNIIVSRNTVYAKRRTSTGNRAMHRIILSRKLGRELVKGEMVDHINGDGLDNRRENLRLATNAQNQQNRKKMDNKNPYKGITYHKRSQVWQAQIRVNGKSFYLGQFNTPEEAHETYKQASIKYHGEFANFGDNNE